MAITFREETGAQFEAGDPAPTAGHLSCADCGFGVSPHAREAMPRCPACGGARFRRGRMFEPAKPAVETVPARDSMPGDVAAARDRLTSAGPHLLWQHDDGVEAAALGVGWSRIGRAHCADVRIDDPTVARRHALIVRTPGGELRALDDRSTNGLFVNGKRVEWTSLCDGDELEIGRFRLYVASG